MTDVPGAIGSTDKPPFARGTLSYTEGFNRLERQQTVAPSGGDLERLALSSPLLEIPASISLPCLTIDHYAVTSPQAGPEASEPVEDRGATTEFARTPNDRPVEDRRSRRRAHQAASSE